MGGLVMIGFLLLFFLGFPIAACMGLPALAYIVLRGFPLEMVAQRMANTFQSYTLIAVPLFIFLGNIMNTAGLTRRIFRFADKTVGWMPGGLAQVNNFASLIFAGMSGSALADIGGLGKIEIEAMHDKGFPDKYSAAVTIASSTLGPIFPPSIPIILYASVAGCSVVRLLIGGILPAIAAMIILMIMTGIICVRRKYPRGEKGCTFKEFMSAFFPALPALLAPILTIAGMLVGIFTPTEAASMSVAYVLLVSILIYREFTWAHFLTSLKDTIKTTASIMVIFPAAALFSWVLTIERIPQEFTTMMLGISNNPQTLLIIVNVMLLIVGMFMGNTEAIVLIVPILAPLMTGLGVDPIHLGMIIVFNLMIGLITPPFAMSLYMASDMVGVKMSTLTKEVLPYLIALIIALIVITYWPSLTTFLPNLFFGVAA